MRDWMRIIEGAYDEDYGEDGEAQAGTGSFGWWVFPNAEVEEMPEMGSHGVTAHVWLKANVPGYRNDDFDESIEHLKEIGGVRVATFHGSDEMNIDFDPKNVSKKARRATLRLMAQTRADFSRYWVDGEAGPKSCSYSEAAAALRS